MADNVQIAPGIFAASDDIGGVQYQRVKVTAGADGAATDVSAAAPLPVTAISSALPTGAATAANQTTLIGHVDGVEALLATIDADTSALAAVVSGSEMQVDVVSFPRVTLTTVTGTVASSGDNTVIAAPSAGTRIVVHLLKYQLEAATATTVIVKNGSTAIDRTYCAQGQGYVEQPASGKEIRLADAAALVLNLSGANSVGYRVRYTTEAV
jgi:hypothetical protein